MHEEADVRNRTENKNNFSLTLTFLSLDLQSEIRELSCTYL